MWMPERFRTSPVSALIRVPTGKVGHGVGGVRLRWEHTQYDVT
jgi:hypothetical protein